MRFVKNNTITFTTLLMYRNRINNFFNKSGFFYEKVFVSLSLDFGQGVTTKSLLLRITRSTTYRHLPMAVQAFRIFLCY